MRNKTGMQMLAEAKEEIEKVWIDEMKHVSDKVWKIVIEKLMKYEKDDKYDTKEDIFKEMDKVVEAFKGIKSGEGAYEPLLPEDLNEQYKSTYGSWPKEEKKDEEK